jgi:uncharacterized protein
MFRTWLFVAFAALCATASAADLEGNWSGTWTKNDDALAVTVTFAKTGDRYSGSFDSDALQVAAIPLSDVNVATDRVRFELKGDATTTMFEGTLKGSDLSGRLSEGPINGTFQLKRSPAPPAIATREVSFANGPVTLAGEMLLPSTPGRHPAILFLHGSGPEGRWAARYLARKFASRGFVALIYDKRGVGASKGDWQTSGFEDLADDAAAGLRFLAAQPEVDAARLGIYGHSQGATIAPLVAVRAGNVSFVIASAGSGIDTAATEIYSIENAIGVAQLPAAEQVDAKLFVKTIVDVAYKGAPRTNLDQVVKRFRTRPWFFEPPPPDHSYWSFSRRIASYDALAFWRQVKARVFLVYGAHDQRVPPQQSADAILGTLKAAGNNRATVKIYPNAAHTFHIVPQEPKNGWSKRVPGYADTLVDWALARN